MYIKNPEYFITTVREGSISKAAEKLYLSQPYLSQCIARTEKELGVKLFDRSHMPLKLTEAGKIYMRYLESVGVLPGKLQPAVPEAHRRFRQPESEPGTDPPYGIFQLAGQHPAAGYPAKLL